MYIVCAGFTYDELAEKVSKLMREGYYPHGSMVIFTTASYNTPAFHQPMILFNEKELNTGLK